MDSVVRGSDLDINIIIASLKYLVNKHNLNNLDPDRSCGWWWYWCCGLVMKCYRNSVKPSHKGNSPHPSYQLWNTFQSINQWIELFVAFPYRKSYFVDNKLEFSGVKLAESYGFRYSNFKVNSQVIRFCLGCFKFKPFGYFRQGWYCHRWEAMEPWPLWSGQQYWRLGRVSSRLDFVHPLQLVSHFL